MVTLPSIWSQKGDIRTRPRLFWREVSPSPSLRRGVGAGEDEGRERVPFGSQWAIDLPWDHFLLEREHPNPTCMRWRAFVEGRKKKVPVTLPARLPYYIHNIGEPTGSSNYSPQLHNKLPKPSPYFEAVVFILAGPSRAQGARRQLVNPSSPGQAGLVCSGIWSG